MNRRGFLGSLLAAPVVAMVPDVLRPGFLASLASVVTRVAVGSLYLASSGAWYIATGRGTWERMREEGTSEDVEAAAAAADIARTWWPDDTDHKPSIVFGCDVSPRYP